MKKIPNAKNINLLTGISLTLAIGAGYSCTPKEKAENPRKPNIVLIVADDMGYGDLSCLVRIKSSTEITGCCRVWNANSPQGIQVGFIVS